MGEPVNLPIERHMAGAVRFLLGIPSRWWRERFTGNPLLAWETRLGEGRRWWRSPALWCVLLSLALAGWSIWGEIGDMLVLRTLRADNPQDQSLAFALRDSPLRHWVSFASWMTLSTLPILFVSRAWAQESDDGSREQLAMSLITAKQLLAARLLLWLGVALSLPVVLGLWGFLKPLAAGAMNPPEGSILRLRELGGSQGQLQTEAGWAVIVAIFSVVNRLATFAGALTAISMATLVTVRWRRPLAGLLAGVAARESLDLLMLPLHRVAIPLLRWAMPLGGVWGSQALNFPTNLARTVVAVVLLLLARREVLRAYHFTVRGETIR